MQLTLITYGFRPYCGSDETHYQDFIVVDSFAKVKELAGEFLVLGRSSLIREARDQISSWPQWVEDGAPLELVFTDDSCKKQYFFKAVEVHNLASENAFRDFVNKQCL
jgi:hypothetical protein